MLITPCRPKWKGTMTDRERFNNQMHYKSVDRCFNMEFGYWNENFEIWKKFKEKGIRNNNEADIFFNFDEIKEIGGNVCLNSGGQIGWANPYREACASIISSSAIAGLTVCTMFFASAMNASSLF